MYWGKLVKISEPKEISVFIQNQGILDKIKNSRQPK